MTLQKLPYDFTVCKITSVNTVDFDDSFVFVSKTEEELSLVCKSGKVPDNCTHAESGWKGFQIQGVLDFSMIGVLADISAVLKENNISIFVISTYNTDYIFVKSENFEKSAALFANKGYAVI